MSALRIWRKSAGQTQEQLAVKLAENPKTYSAYERGASPIPPEILAKLRTMGYMGPLEQHPSAIPSLTREDLELELKGLREYLENRFSGILGGLSPQETHTDVLDKGTQKGQRMDAEARKKEKSMTGQEVPIILPEHVQEAWIILAKAVDKAGADYRFMDRKALGLLVGLTAQEIAEKGFSEDTQARLLARAEKFVHTASRNPIQ